MTASLIHLFIPQKIAEITSPVNGLIEIYRYLGSYRIVIADLTQSGGLVRNLWQTALQDAAKKRFHLTSPQTALILGFGAGSAAQVLEKRWPGIKITGVELDPVMIELGQKYLGTRALRSTTVVNADAFAWLAANSFRYDLILIDMYLGRQIPPAANTTGFMAQVKAALTPTGAALFNRLTLKGDKPQAEKFVEKLRSVFPVVTRLRTLSNWILLAGNRLPDKLQ